MFQKLIQSSLLAGLAIWCGSAPMWADTIGVISVCYSCNGTGTHPTGDAAVDAALTVNSSVASDGILFAFKNTSAFDITGAVISVSGTSPADSFALGTIAAGSEVILMPGLSNDGFTHPGSGFFRDIGITMDTSDGAGGISDSSVFTFSGTSQSQAVVSITVGTDAADGTFTPSDPGLIRSWISPSGGSTSFVGDGPNGDPGCNDCYFGEVATLSIPGSSTPEPGSLGLMVSGLGFAAWTLRHRRR